MANQYKRVIADKKNQATRLMNKSQLTKCNVAIHTASAASAAAGAIPIPVADAIPITTAQVTMVLALGSIFDAKISESAAKGLIGAAASTFVGRNLVKLIPIVGWGFSAAVAAGVTEVIGWTIAVDLAKEAKNKWENEHCTATGDTSKPNSSESTSDASDTQGQSEVSRENLSQRADEFITKKKTRTQCEEEFLVLLSDFEKILDSLPDGDPLRKKYDELTLIIE